jgi:hypothetical protein
MIFPLLGGSDRFGMQTNVHSAFQTVRNELFNACAALPRQGVSHDKHLLETRIFSAAGLLRAHFERVRGKSFRMSSDQIRMAFDLSTSVIKNSGIATIFGASDLDPEWPLSANVPNSATLIENIGTSLSLSGASRLTFSEFLVLQRTAQVGAQAIRLVLSHEKLSEEHIRDLVRLGYEWHTSLRQLSSMSQVTKGTPVTQRLPSRQSSGSMTPSRMTLGRSPQGKQPQSVMIAPGSVMPPRMPLTRAFELARPQPQATSPSSVMPQRTTPPSAPQITLPQPQETSRGSVMPRIAPTVRSRSRPPQ